MSRAPRHLLCLTLTAMLTVTLPGNALATTSAASDRSLTEFRTHSETAPTGPATTSDFYTPPAQLPARNGAIIKNQRSRFYLDPLELTQANASVQRIMYKSTDARGRAMAVTGTVLTPTSAWSGPDKRPLISYAVGTQGLADKCAPSRQLAAGSEYEGAFLQGLLLRGYGVVITDYEGLGTPGVHTYVVRASEAHAVLDAARAAQRLDAAHLPDSGPVGISGYSQGGTRLGPRWTPAAPRRQRPSSPGPTLLSSSSRAPMPAPSRQTSR